MRYVGWHEMIVKAMVGIQGLPGGRELGGISRAGEVEETCITLRGRWEGGRHFVTSWHSS